MCAKRASLKTADLNSKGQASGMFNVSQSKVKTYRRCQYAYFLRYIEKLKKKTKSRPLQFGSLVHGVIEHWAEGNDWEEMLDGLVEKFGKIFKAEREAYGEIIEDTKVIMREYFEYYDERDLVFERIAGRSAEHKFNIEIIPGVNWNGKIDFKGRTRDKRRWMGEHKTFNRRPNVDERWRNLQGSTYIRANDILGWTPVSGVLWDYIWSKAPIRPQILTNGSLSNKKIDTLPGAVIAAIEAEGLSLKKHKAHIDKAAENRPLWFERVFTPVNTSVVDAVFADFVLTIREMVDREDRKVNHWPKNIDKHCGWCDFEGICRAELQGLDRDYVIQHDFTKDKDNGIEIPDAAEE